MAPKASLKGKGADIFFDPAAERGAATAARQRPSLRSVRVLPTPPPLPREEELVETPPAPAPAAPPKPRPAPAQPVAAPAPVEPAKPATRSASAEELAEARVAEQIDQLYRKTIDAVSESKSLADFCLGLLKRARTLLDGHPDSLAEVESLLEQVRAVLERADRSVRASGRIGPPLAGYHVAWFVILLLLLAFDREVAAWLGWHLGRADLASLGGLIPFWTCLVWGGIGSVAGALFSLYRHIAQRDFDSEHKIAYLVQPVLGAIVGALVYLVMAALFFVAGEGQTFTSGAISAANPLVLLAALAGFQQRHAYGLLERATRRLLRAPSKSEGIA